MRDIDNIINKVGELIIENGHDENDWDAVEETLNQVPEGEEHQFISQLIEKAKNGKGWDIFYLYKISDHFGLPLSIYI